MWSRYSDTVWHLTMAWVPSPQWLELPENVPVVRLIMVLSCPCRPQRKQLGIFLLQNFPLPPKSRAFTMLLLPVQQMEQYYILSHDFLSVLHQTPKYCGPYIKVHVFLSFQKDQLLKKERNVSAWPPPPRRDGYLPGSPHPWNICISMWHRPRLLISACIHPPCNWFLLCVVPPKYIFSLVNLCITACTHAQFYSAFVFFQFRTFCNLHSPALFIYTPQEHINLPRTFVWKNKHEETGVILYLGYLQHNTYESEVFIPCTLFIYLNKSKHCILSMYLSKFRPCIYSTGISNIWNSILYL